MRGRLIRPTFAQIHRLDRNGMVPPPHRVLFDPDFREPIGVDLDGDGIGEHVREELPPVLIPCQVEPLSFESLHLSASGKVARVYLDLVMHMNDLDRLGLVDSHGRALLERGDRLGGLFSESGVQILDGAGSRELLLTSARPSGFGFERGTARSLLFLSFADRAPSTAQGAMG